MGKLARRSLESSCTISGRGASEDAVRRMIYEADADENGSIDFAEFLTLMARRMKRQEQHSELKQAFQTFDKDGDGKITVSELKAVLTGLGESLPTEEVEEILRQADKNGDGVSIQCSHFL